MKYAIYFTWNDGIEDSFNVENAKEKNINIHAMIRKGDFKEILFCKIYASGEYGLRTKAL